MKNTEIPNLDCLDDTELADFVHAVETGDSILTGNDSLYYGYLYASSLIRARRARVSGFIGLALTHEKECEKIYNKIPSKFRW